MPRRFICIGCDAEIFEFEAPADAPLLCAKCMFMADWIDDLIQDELPPSPAHEPEAPHV